jgi:hypothetical protein
LFLVGKKIRGYTYPITFPKSVFDSKKRFFLALNEAASVRKVLHCRKKRRWRKAIAR